MGLPRPHCTDQFTIPTNRLMNNRGPPESACNFKFYCITFLFNILAIFVFNLHCIFQFPFHMLCTKHFREYVQKELLHIDRWRWILRLAFLTFQIWNLQPIGKFKNTEFILLSKRNLSKKICKLLTDKRPHPKTCCYFQIKIAFNQLNF